MLTNPSPSEIGSNYLYILKLNKKTFNKNPRKCQFFYTCRTPAVLLMLKAIAWYSGVETCGRYYYLTGGPSKTQETLLGRSIAESLIITTYMSDV